MIAFLLKWASCLSFAVAGIVGGYMLRAHGLYRLRSGLRRQQERLEREADRSGLEGLFASPVWGAVAMLVRPAVALRRRRRLKRIDAQLGDALVLLGNALRAGLSFAQAITLAAHEVPAPLGQEFERVAGALRLGRRTEEALEALRERAPTEDVTLFVQTVTILRRSGGNLIETFERLAATIEARRRVGQRLQTLMANNAVQGAVLLLMPWLLAGALAMVAPEYLLPLISTRLGNLFMAVAVMLELIGGLWLRRIVSIRV